MYCTEVPQFTSLKFTDLGASTALPQFHGPLPPRFSSDEIPLQPLHYDPPSTTLKPAK